MFCVLPPLFVCVWWGIRHVRHKQEEIAGYFVLGDLGEFCSSSDCAYQSHELIYFDSQMYER